MKRIISIALSVLFMAGLLAGCQPTPEQDIVIGKDNDGWEEAKVPSGEEMPDLGVPKTWQSEVSGNDLEIKIDAEVDFMENTTFPVYVVQGKIFTQDEADAIMNALFGDAELYTENGVRTKDEIDQNIKYYTKELEAAKKWYEEASDPAEKESAEGMIETYQELLQDLIKEKETAPDGKTRTPSSRVIGFFEDQELSTRYGTEVEIEDGAYKYIWTDAARKKAEDDGNVGIYGWVNMPNGKAMEFILRNRPLEGLGSYFVGNSSVRFTLGEDASRKPHDENAVPISREEAIEMGNDMLGRMGISYEFIDCDEYHYVYDFTFENDEYVEKAEKNPSYMLRYCTAMPNTRQMKITPSPFDNRSINKENFTTQLFQETLYIEIDADGTIELFWDSPIEVVGTESESTKLLPWDEVSGVIEKGLKMKNIFSTELNDDNSIVSRTLKVDRIVLSYMQIKKKDNLSERYYIPVWDVIGTMTLKFRDDYDPYAIEGGGYIVDENHERVSFENCSVLTINAIDGTIIERSLGY